MSEPNENSLDQHFVSQVRLLSDVYAHNISQSDYKLSQHWLQRFHMATRREKYARNCLMLLLYGQLREMGRLGRPFTTVDSAHCGQLEQVLNAYLGKLEPSELGTEAELTSLTHTHVHENALADNACSSGDSTNSYLVDGQQVERSECGDPASYYIKDHGFERLTQQNQALINEINVMHARTLETEQRYRLVDSNWQLRMSQGQLPTHKSHLILPLIERGMLQALRDLKNWTAASGPLNFLGNALQDVVDFEPGSQQLLQELDRKLEFVLTTMVEQAGERREKNVRMLYDQLFKQQQDALQTKQELLRHEQQALLQARQQLQAHVQDLKKRDLLHWQQKTQIDRYPTSNSKNKNKNNNNNNSNCGCSDCQAEREQTSRSASPAPTKSRSPSPAPSSRRQRRTCQYCEPQDPQLVEQILQATLDAGFSRKC